MAMFASEIPEFLKFQYRNLVLTSIQEFRNSVSVLEPLVAAVTKGKCECVLKQNKHRVASSTLSFVPQKKILKTNKKEKNLTKSRTLLLTIVCSEISKCRFEESCCQHVIIT